MKSFAPGTVDGLLAHCPAGKVVVGTGFYASIAGVGFVQSFSGTSVGGGFINRSPSYADVEVQAICAPGSVSASASGTAVASIAAKGDSLQDKLDDLRL